MNPVEAGARNVATVAGHHAKNLASEASRGFDKFAKDSGLAEVSRKARNAATEFGKDAESAARSAAYKANKIASQASKSLSSAGSRALESGARVVDDIFGTSYSKRSKLRDARKRRRHQDVVEKQQRAHKQNMEMREQRTHENAMKRKNTADQAKRDRARSNREKYDWAQSRKHAKGMEKANAKDQAKRDRAMTKYKQRKTAEGILERNAAEKKAKKNVAKMLKARKYGDSYKNEKRVSAWENYGDYKGRKLQDRRIDAAYGKLGKEAYTKEAKRRAKLYKDSNKYIKKKAMKKVRDSNGTTYWRDNTISRNGYKYRR